ncbi:MAG TPA: invasion associated locus B family protein [Methyloceanibacter sp.]|nr:invasion associated locus B family protein [Methyloceanibacter sp.]
MGRNLLCAIAAGFAGLVVAGAALAQGQGAPGSAVPKPAQTAPAAKAPAGKPKAPPAKIEANFGQWSLVCNQPKSKEEKPTCSLIQALVERDSNKLVFRVTIAYGPKGNLVLRIDGPTGVALQKGLEFSPDEVKIYRMPFTTCLPRGCSAVLVVADDLKRDLQKSQKGSITVYALSGQAVRAPAQFDGFADGLAALDKRQAKP